MGRLHQTKLPPGGSWYGGLINHYTDRQENTHLKNGYLNPNYALELRDEG